MQINGGCARVDDILNRPVNILASGPAAAPAAALHYMRTNDIGSNIITCDMGGTSLDVCVITNGQAAMSRNVQVENQPIGLPAVECVSIGAGGGSIAWVDQGGALRIGPASAGSYPGPACYGKGGEKPTVTDSNVVLGYLVPEFFLGGRRVLHDELSKEAVEKYIGKPLGLSLVDAAYGIRRVVNANMVGAIRAISVELGVDPRDYVLICAGGAGGLHAASLARELGMKKVFIPLEAGVLCSFGMTVTDVRHDYVEVYHCISDDVDLEKLNFIYKSMEEKAKKDLIEEGFDEKEIIIERSVDARYPGQIHELTVNVDASGYITEDTMLHIEKLFHKIHNTQFAYCREEFPIEFLHWRLTALGRQNKGTKIESYEVNEEAEAIRTTKAWFGETKKWEDTKLIDVNAVNPGKYIEGPAIVTSATTTIVVNPGDVLKRASKHGFIIDIKI